MFYTGRRRTLHHLAERSYRENGNLRHKTEGGANAIKEFVAGMLTIDNEAPPPLPPRTTELQTVSPLTLLTAETAAATEETVTSNGKISSTSTEVTIVVDVEDDGVLEETVFLQENDIRSGLQSVASKNGNRTCLFEHHSKSCVSTCSSREFVNTGGSGHIANMSPFQDDEYTDSHTGNVSLNGKQEADSHGYVNIASARQASTLHEPKQSEANGCINVPKQSPSLQLPTDQTCGPYYVNCTRQLPHEPHPSNDHGYANFPSQASLSQPMTRQTSGPVCTSHAIELHEPSPIHDHGYANVPSKSASSLKPLACQTTAPVCASHVHEPTEPSPSNECGYVNIPSHSSTLQPLSSNQTTGLFSTSHTNEPCEPCSILDHGYLNVSRQSSLLQPTPGTIKVMSSSQIPPRTILRSNCYKSSNDNSSTVPLPPRLTTTHQRRLPQSSTHKAPPLTLLPVEDPLIKPTETESKSSSGCGISNQVEKLAEEDRHTVTNDNLGLNNVLGCSRDTSDGRAKCGDDAVDNLTGRGMCDSLESLDVWPPVIPRHSDLKFIVPKHDSKDLYTDQIVMLSNKSYVKH